MSRARWDTNPTFGGGIDKYRRETLSSTAKDSVNKETETKK